MRRLMTLLAALLMASHAMAQSSGYRATAWITTAAAQVRLIVPEAFKAGEAVHGGIEVQLEPGAKTYWRSPGETGVAPALDLSASRGLKTGAMLFPAPVAFDDGAGGIAVGYTESLIFPLSLTSEGLAPAVLSVQFDFGVCHRNMCMPAAASFIVKPGEGEADTALNRRMADWLARVPLRSGHPVLSVSALRETRAGEVLTLGVEARAPAAGEPSLFVEADGLSFTTRRLGPSNDGIHRFEAVSALTADHAGRPTGPVTLTLVAGGIAIEQTMTPAR